MGPSFLPWTSYEVADTATMIGMFDACFADSDYFTSPSTCCWCESGFIDERVWTLWLLAGSEAFRFPLSEARLTTAYIIAESGSNAKDEGVGLPARCAFAFACWTPYVLDIA